MQLSTATPPHRPPLQLLPLSSAGQIGFLGFRPLARSERGIWGFVTCSISKIHGYGTVDYERRPVLKWSSLYRRIATMENPGLGPAAVLEQWEAEEGMFSKWNLCRVVKELRKFRRFDLALEVFEWMAAQGDRFTFTSSDVAIELDLIAKVRGVELAEEYFSTLSDTLKDKRTYGALLNVYGHAKMKEKAESAMEAMIEKGYVTSPLPFNVMMTLYMNVGEHERVGRVVDKMKENDVKLDVFSYNIWITNCGAMEDAEEMERVVERMISDSSVNANWTTYTTLASMYIKLGKHEKAESCLKGVEIRVTGRSRLPYNFLLGLYSSIGKRDEVYRVWSWYKSSFPAILNMGYQSMLSALIKVKDVDGAESIFDEWLSSTTNYDPRICNIMLGCYVREGLVGKAMGVVDRLLEKGGKPKSSSWEILAEGYIIEKQVSEAVSCLREAVACKDDSSNWRPKPTNVASILAVCEEQNEDSSVDMLKDLLRNIGCLDKEEYQMLFRGVRETSPIGGMGFSLPN